MRSIRLQRPQQMEYVLPTPSVAYDLTFNQGFIISDSALPFTALKTESLESLAKIAVLLTTFTDCCCTPQGIALDETLGI